MLLSKRPGILVLAACLLFAVDPAAASDVAESPEVTPEQAAEMALEAFGAAAPELVDVPVLQAADRVENSAGTTLASPDGTTDVLLPEDLSDGITVDDPDESDAAVAIEMPFQSAARLVASDRGVVYDNDNGTYTLPLPQDDGSLVLGMVINGPAAPTDYRYVLDVPEGGSLQSVGRGVGILDAEGSLSGGIAPPWAKDADGGSIATHFEIQGNTVVQVVDHRTGSATYPVTADPWLGVDLFDWTRRRDCPNSHCPSRESGYVISAGLSKWAMYWRYTGAGYAILNGSGWEELVTRRPAADNYNNRMRPQWTCHAAGAYPPLTGGDSWDIESWRPEIWDWGVWVRARCNW